jgi:hypothetical protein
VNIFESLIQVISMLFGFTLIAIFYYLGKVNNQKKDTLKEFLEFMEGPNQILNLMERFADELKPFVNKMPLAILKGWFSESLLKFGEDTQALLPPGTGYKPYQTT